MQAGTGTGKSLAYLVPAIARAVDTDEPVVVSTATIALQRQLVDRDLPRLAESLADAQPPQQEVAHSDLVAIPVFDWREIARFVVLSRDRRGRRNGLHFRFPLRGLRRRGLM